MNGLDIRYDGLKFWKTEYKFKNKDECGKYFDAALKSGVEVYKKELKNYMQENLHIFYSMFWACRLLSVLILVASLVGTTAVSQTFLLLMGIGTGMCAIVWWKISKMYQERMLVTEMINDNLDDVLYEVRDELINKDNA